jgi:hypothetical protein
MVTIGAEADLPQEVVSSQRTPSAQKSSEQESTCGVDERKGCAWREVGEVWGGSGGGREKGRVEGGGLEAGRDWMGGRKAEARGEQQAGSRIKGTTNFMTPSGPTQSRRR